MSIYETRDLIGKAELIALAKITAIKTWPEAAESGGVGEEQGRKIRAAQRLDLLDG